ncbi:MAG: hypothetical protein AAGF06_05430, partial [Pseudomonadota bacterium]
TFEAITKDTAPERLNSKQFSSSDVTENPGNYFQGVKYHGNGRTAAISSALWYVVRLNQSLISTPDDQPETNPYKRDVHIVLTRNSAGKWVSRCG